jgi:ferredoxin
MSEAAKRTWHGIPRETIQWHPSVIAERCVGCGMCVTSCGKNVYAFDYESNKPVVAAPQACMIGCTTCAAICTLDAIEFPSIGFVRQIIRRNKLLRQAKDTLRATVEKYDIKQHKPVLGIIIPHLCPSYTGGQRSLI